MADQNPFAMRGLFGDFSTMPLKDLVVYLGNKQATGTLTLEREGIKKEVLLKAGNIVSVSSNEPREYLGQFLINMGHITEDQFTKAYNTQKQTNVFLGKILTMIGLVSEQTVMNALSMKMRETLLDAFHWEDGAFNFDASSEPIVPDGLDLQVPLLDVHREGEFRETAWQAIRAAFPHGKVRLEVTERNLPEKPKPGSLDERLIALIKAGHSIDEMVLALHATDFFLYQRLYALYRLEAVKVSDQPSFAVETDEPLTGSEVMGEETSTGEILAHVATFMEAQNFRDAEALARKAHEMAPTSETQEVLRQAESALGDQLKAALMEGGRVPALTVSATQLKEMQLTAPERYLLSRINGTRDVAAIINVSPLKQLDALKYFQRFIYNGLIALN
jgi:hypothetical protein